MDLVGGNFRISALRMLSSNHRGVWSTKTVADPIASCPPARSATRGSRRTAEAFEVNARVDVITTSSFTTYGVTAQDPAEPSPRTHANTPTDADEIPCSPAIFPPYFENGPPSPQLPVFVDPDLLQCDEVWAAAAMWNDNVGAAPADIVRVAGGDVTELKRTWPFTVR